MLPSDWMAALQTYGPWACVVGLCLYVLFLHKVHRGDLAVIGSQIEEIRMDWRQKDRELLGFATESVGALASATEVQRQVADAVREVKEELSRLESDEGD